MEIIILVNTDSSESYFKTVSNTKQVLFEYFGQRNYVNILDKPQVRITCDLTDEDLLVLDKITSSDVNLLISNKNLEDSKIVFI
jgi:hypothetical protein